MKTEEATTDACPHCGGSGRVVGGQCANFWDVNCLGRLLKTLDDAQAIKEFRMRTLRGALKLEIAGMKRNGRSVYSIVKEEFGFKGSKQKVLEQLEKNMQKNI